MARIRSLAISRGVRIDVPLLLIASAVLLYAGITLPIVETRALIFWSDTYSVLSAVDQLWSSDEWVLAIVLGVLSIGFPALKLLMLAILWTIPMSTQWRRGLLLKIQFLSRWAMFDVFAVAILAVIVQAGEFMQARPRAGIYCFAVSIVLTMVVTLLIGRAAARRH